MRSRFEQQEPRSRRSRDHCFNALAIEPARDFNAALAANRRDVRIHASAHAMRYARHDAREP
jgi:hypothetical protein